MQYTAHIRESDKEIQTVKQHLLDAKEIAEFHGAKLNIKYLAGLATLLHDFGKATSEFKDYIHTAVYDPEHAKKRGSVDHSTAGGKLLFDMYHTKDNNVYEKILAEILGNAIISHHSYLQDYLSPDLETKYLNRVKVKPIEYYADAKDYFFTEVMLPNEFQEYVSKAIKELANFIGKKNNDDFFAAVPLEQPLFFLTKIIFSILIDADRTNTRLFEENKKVEETINIDLLFQKYYEKLQEKIVSFEDNTDKTVINVLRKEMSQQCEDFANKPSGIYTLSIPTGGGKTLASFRYALKHALLHNKKKIIYVVPYNTIIEQNAKEIRDIIQDDEHLLEHHSNVFYFDEADEGDFDERQQLQKRLLLAKDNWDSPIIFTSMVQFLNVFYEKGTRNIRRLHNLSDAVIIFDEAQKVPTKCVSLFNEALNYLNAFMNTTSILCTATQPALDGVLHKLNFSTDGEMVKNLDEVIDNFKRVELHDYATDRNLDTEQLADIILDHEEKYQSQLIILNTKTVVRKLYLELKDRTPTSLIYHLSTSMCPMHRMDILKEIKEKLKNQEQVICISTQLIEAGVDISFESVIRSLTGLDSIAQAAGRCNRHGEREIGDVFLINHQEENLTRLEEISEGKEITKKILIDMKNNPELYNGNLLSKQAMDGYFSEFYDIFRHKLDYVVKNQTYTHVDLLMALKRENKFVHEFKAKYDEKYELIFASSINTSAKNFKVIDDLTKTIIVPYDEGEQIIADLSGEKTIEDFSRLIKKAQLYSISIYNYEQQSLDKQDAIITNTESSMYVLAEGFYSKEYGLSVEKEVEMSLQMY